LEYCKKFLELEYTARNSLNLNILQEIHEFQHSIHDLGNDTHELEYEIHISREGIDELEY
jgi:hypothetical protein